MKIEMLSCSHLGIDVNTGDYICTMIGEPPSGSKKRIAFYEADDETLATRSVEIHACLPLQLIGRHLSARKITDKCDGAKVIKKPLF